MTLHPFVQYPTTRITWIDGGYHVIPGTDRRRAAGNSVNHKGLALHTPLAPSQDAFYGRALYGMGRSFLSAYMHLMLDVDVQHRAAAALIMNRIRNLARESERRIRPAQAPEAGALPTPAGLAGAC